MLRRIYEDFARVDMIIMIASKSVRTLQESIGD